MGYKICTSYFGNAKNIATDEYALIGIAGRSPEGWRGLEYRKLAPSWSIWNEWHLSMVNLEQAIDRQKAKDSACAVYTDRFKKEILDKLNALDVATDIFKLADGKMPVLLCYEKPGDFCHRHLVADWLNASLDCAFKFPGFSVVELNANSDNLLF